MGSRPTVGVVTVTYNSADVLPEFLYSIAIQTYCDLFLFAVDNGSKDGTIKLLESCPDPRLRVIANPDNRGVAEGNNQGIRAAMKSGCEWILLVNNDTVFDANLIEGLAAGIEQHKCDMVCPKIVYFDEPERIWAAGGTFQPLLGYRSRHFGEGEMDQGQLDTARQVTYAPTCCVLIRSAVFSNVGLMDSRYFVYVDDVDFMYRANKAGQKLVYLPHLRLLHKVGYLTGGNESAFATRYGTRNLVYFQLKNVRGIHALLILILYQLYYLGNLLSFRFSLIKYKRKQRAFWEGLSMARIASKEQRR